MSNKVIFVPPTYEDIQHEATSLDENGKVLQQSYHTDISLMLRIDKLKCDAATISRLRDNLQPLIDSSDFRDSFNKSFDKMTDEQLIESCPSRYVQNLSEQMEFMKTVAEKDKESRAALAKQQKEAEEKDRIDKENEEFQKKLSQLFD